MRLTRLSVNGVTFPQKQRSHRNESLYGKTYFKSEQTIFHRIYSCKIINSNDNDFNASSNFMAFNYFRILLSGMQGQVQQV